MSEYKIALAGIKAVEAERKTAEKEGREIDYTVRKKAQDEKRKELAKERDEKLAAKTEVFDGENKEAEKALNDVIKKRKKAKERARIDREKSIKKE